ncbi:CASP-like protein 5C1 [Impatiens glandulifera]|uniref:CASP-like protein 5C1 n=1 Tax=Impatiens glandulifera TaxID=253017 RepID=UPI001FB08E0D|nr:CASP-like protein 5C1 [Impatiens glandulifera]
MTEEVIVAGSLGTSTSFGLRFGQAIFSSSSLLFMSFGVQFYSYTAFCFLVTVMGLVIPWSFTLALLDGYAILHNYPVRHPTVIFIILLGDGVLSIFTLAAASSTVSVVDVLLKADEHEEDGYYCPQRCCSRYQISAAMAFLSWILSTASSLFNLWLLPSL